MSNHLSPPEMGVTQEIANLVGGVVVGTINMLANESLDLGNAEVFTFDTPQELFAMLPSGSGAMASMAYQSGFDGPLTFILDLNTATGLADLMMGTTPAPGTEITDMHLSAVGEAMSQMAGAISSNLSQFLSQPVDLSSPEMAAFSHEKMLEAMPQLALGGIALLKYTLVGNGNLANAEVFQVAPLQDLQQQVQVVQAQVPAYAQAPAMAGVGAADIGGVSTSGGFSSAPGGPVTVQQVEFTSFDSHVGTAGATNKNLELVMDVTLNLTVELGRTELSIKEVLELTRGSVIELNRIAGEPVDLFANGKMIAKGEVVVIEDNFGIRITSIVAPADRLRGL